MENPPKVYVKLVDVTTRLAQLGLVNGVDLLWESLKYGAAYAVECTRHDPASLGGTLLWGKTNRRLRDILVPLDWKWESPGNYQLTVHPSREWCIAVAAGDERTGRWRENEEPATRTERGPETLRIVQQNQLSFAQQNPAFDWPRDPSTRLTRLLLHFIDHDKGLMRAELSLPAYMTTDGFVVAWSERIILPQIDLTSIGLSTFGTSGDGFDSGDAIDIPIAKKA